MPRKDRRFRADDILRLYCRNLTAEQRALVDAVGYRCEDENHSPEDMFISVLRAMGEPPLSLVVERLPGGQYLADVITLILMIADNRVAVSDAEWKRINDDVLDTTRPVMPLISPRWLPRP